MQEWCQQMDKLQKLKQSFICRFGWKAFPFYNYKYIHLRAIFVLEKGVCFYWVVCFYWDIYGIILKGKCPNGSGYHLNVNRNEPT